jgi:nucleoside-diphosphate-sugar epimerase
MKVVAIGATGFIGIHAIRYLAEQGHEVAVVHRGDTQAVLPNGVQRILGDRDALFEMRREFERFAPDVVLDVIPYTEKQAEDLLRTFGGLSGRVVAVSSADVYRNYDGLRWKASAPPDPVPLAESSPLREALYPYRGSALPFMYRDDYEKILVERLVLNQAGLPGTVLRLPAVYGPGDKQHRLRRFLRRMDDGRPAIVLSDGEARWRPTRGYVENVAAAIVLAVIDARASGQAYNVGEDPALTEREWIQRIGEVAKWSGDIVTIPDEQLPAQLRQPYDWRYHLATDTRRLRETLAYREPVSQQDGIEATIQWEHMQADETERPDYSVEDEVLAHRRGADDAV